MVLTQIITWANRKHCKCCASRWWVGDIQQVSNSFLNTIFTCVITILELLNEALNMLSNYDEFKEYGQELKSKHLRSWNLSPKPDFIAIYFGALISMESFEDLPLVGRMSCNLLV